MRNLIWNKEKSWINKSQRRRTKWIFASTYSHLKPSWTIFYKSFCLVARWSWNRRVAATKSACFAWIEVNHSFIIFFELSANPLLDIAFFHKLIQFAFGNNTWWCWRFETDTTISTFVLLSDCDIWWVTVTIVMFWNACGMKTKLILCDKKTKSNKIINR